jgi:hypothetical protein
MSLNGYSYVKGDPVNFADPSGMILESPATYNACYSFSPILFILENPQKTAALNATVVVRTVNHQNLGAQKTCDPSKFNFQDYRISGAGLGTLGVSGFWTHDHYEDKNQKRSEGNKSLALSNIHSHDCIQFIGRKGVISVNGTAVTMANSNTPENTLLLSPTMFNWDGNLISLSAIADLVSEGRVEGCGYPCDKGLYYAHQTADLGQQGENIGRSVWEGNVAIGLSGMEININQPEPTQIEIWNSGLLGSYDAGFSIFGYRFYPHDGLKAGDSGGGVFDTRGFLIGVIMAEDYPTSGVFSPIRL